MVIPAYMINESDEIAQAEQAATNEGKARTRNFMRLVLSRKRLINANPDIDKLIEQEEKDKTKYMRRHGVIGFIRNLPSGQRASQQQRDLCMRDQGKELAETGETYVRGHNRGGEKDNEDIEAIEGHRARIRNVGGAVMSDITNGNL